MDLRLIAPAIAGPHGGQRKNAHENHEEASKSGHHTVPLTFRRQFDRISHSLSVPLTSKTAEFFTERRMHVKQFQLSLYALHFNLISNYFYLFLFISIFYMFAYSMQIVI
jgi:hypothetical protein